MTRGDYTWLGVEGSNPRLTISRVDHTVKLASEIPGVSHESMLYFLLLTRS